MIITGATNGALRQAAEKIGVNIDFGRISTDRRIQFTLKLKTRLSLGPGKRNWIYLYQRSSASYFQPDRRVNSVCWHGYRDFLNEVFKIFPNAKATSNFYGKIIHDGKVDESSGDIHIGAPINGGYPALRDACWCPESER